MNSSPLYKKDPSLWVCTECENPLEQQSIQAFYLESAFAATQPICPHCMQTLVPKSIAEGKMFENEKKTVPPTELNNTSETPATRVCKRSLL